MLNRSLLLFLLLIVSAPASAQTCTRTVSICEDTYAPLVGGVRLEGACRKVRLEELCIRDAPVNECVPFNLARITHSNALSDGECRRTSLECTRYRNGKCDRWLLNYTCWNGPLTHTPAELLDRRFHNFEENAVNDCGPLDANPRCTRGGDEITEEYGTRNINGLDVTRAWWRRDRSYDCTDPTLEDTCEPFVDNPVCSQTDHTFCKVEAPDGSCIQMEYGYECDVDPTFEANCAAVNVCVGDACVGAEPDPSPDFGMASAWLNVLDSLSDDFGCGKDGDVIDPETGEVLLAACPTDLVEMFAFYPDIFVGEVKGCGISLDRNCCESPDNGLCSQTSRDLADSIENGTAHHLESFCVQEVFGVCLDSARVYCTYKSKFARVLQEQAHLQTNVQFREYWRGDAACPGLRIDQIELLDWDAIDLSEVFGDIFDAINIPIGDEVSDKLTTGVTQFAPQVQDQFSE